MDSSYLGGRASLGGSRLAVGAGAAAAAKKKEAFCFPMLSNDEICGYLHTKGLHLDEEDLAKPKQEVLRFLYENLITQCMGITPEELHTPKTFGDAPLSDELYEEAIPVLHFHHAL